MAIYNASMSHSTIEENARKGKSKATAAPCACSSSSSGSAVAKRPRLTAEDVEREADEFEGDIDQIVASEDEEAEVRCTRNAPSHAVSCFH